MSFDDFVKREEELVDRLVNAKTKAEYRKIYNELIIVQAMLHQHPDRPLSTQPLEIETEEEKE